MGKSIADLSLVATVGLDLAKHVFQVHAVDADGNIVVVTSLKRKDVLAFFALLPHCLIGLEVCGSAHHWARELIRLGNVKSWGVMNRNLVATWTQSLGKYCGRAWSQALPHFQFEALPGFQS